MPDEISNSDIFRFIQLRPHPGAEEVGAIALTSNTPLAKQIVKAGSTAKRADAANQLLRSAAVREMDDVPFSENILAAIETLRAEKDATVADLLAALPRHVPSDADLDALSDTLLAAFFATRDIPADIERLGWIYRLYRLPSSGVAESTERLAGFPRPPLLAPTLPG